MEKERKKDIEIEIGKKEKEATLKERKKERKKERSLI